MDPDDKWLFCFENQKPDTASHVVKSFTIEEGWKEPFSFPSEIDT